MLAQTSGSVVSGAARRVLFLCSGNYYRSRFAEAVFNVLAERAGSEWRADSRGLRVVPGRNPGPVAASVVRCLEQLGMSYPVADRFPIAASCRDLDEAAVVVGLDATEHRSMVEVAFPGSGERVHRVIVVDGISCLP